ncbi:MAG: hypothetical protein HYX21_01560 [Candidatus Yanofskybacteria bacterium]|nr:hypothetical protein [Candidatus Yanofskybacteria bacterium]
MDIFFKKNLFVVLPVLIFSLFASSNIVFAQTTVSGVCVVRNSFVNAPTFNLPDLGVGYAKKTQPGINTIAELRATCTKEVYQELFQQYCKQNSQPVSAGVISYNEAGKVSSTGSSGALGSGFIFYCNALGADLSAITGACGLRSGEASAPGFFDPDIGVGYIKKRQPGVNSIADLRKVCTREVYEKLLIDYCKQNSKQASPEVIVYGGGGGPQSVGGSAFGSKPMKCPASPTPTKSPIAQALSTVTYPVTELGNCTDQQNCKAYCGISSNYSKCIAFAQKNNLTVEIPDDKKAVVAAMQKGEGPGQCKDEASCRNYCEDIDRIEECVSFAEKFSLASPDELKEIRQMADVKKAGVQFPGNCKTKESCLAYCENSTHAVECMEFAQKAGFIPKEDAEAVSKILPYLKSGGKLPGGCTTKKSCDAYCESDTHTNECVDFAVKAGFMTQEDAEIVKKTDGKGPGNCRSREACDSYCKDETHTGECVDFAVKAGFISAEDAEMAKKFNIQSGPGGCKSKTECEAFCVLPENQDTCFNFAKEHGMLSEEDLKNIEQQREFMAMLDKASPEWLACMEKELGTEFFGRFKTGKITQSEAKSPALEVAQRKCGSKMAQEKQAACLALSCSEFEVCLKALQSGGGGQGGDQQGEGASDPAISAKFQACQKEKMDACLTKPCGEFQACLNSLGGGGEQQQGVADPAVQAKFMSCQPKGGGEQPPVGSQLPVPSPSGSPSEIPVTPELCASFSSVPSCSFVGSPDSQNYQLCKECYPDR